MEAVLDAFLSSPSPLTASQVRRESRQHTSTTERALRSLCEAGWISTDGGRAYALGPRSGVVLGIAVGRESVEAVLIDLHGKRLGSAVNGIAMVAPPRPTRAMSPERLPALLSELIRTAIDSAGGEHHPVTRCAIAWHAVIDAETNEPTSLASPVWQKLSERRGEFTRLVEQAVDLAGLADVPVSFLNDANAELLAETRWGTAQGATCAIGIKVCGGVGAAVLIDGRIHTGGFGRAGELGHLHMSTRGLLPQEDDPNKGTKPPDKVERIEQWNAPGCSCGSNNDHLEQFASTPAIVDRLDERIAGLRSHGATPPRGYNSRAAEIREHHDDPGVQHVMHEVGALLARALCGPVLLLNPQVVVISSVPFHPDLARYVAERLNPIEQGRRIPETRRPKIVAGTSPALGGTLMTAMGAATSAMDDQISRVRAQAVDEKLE